jgi:predicted O-methyltransferase YrrM
MSSLHDFLVKNNIFEMQGNSHEIPQQTSTLSKLASDANIKTIFEIGFNAGHSAETFLMTNPNAKLTSVDILENDALKFGKQYIDATFSNRHTLLLGDSKQIVPTLDTKFDLIFIDGGHDYETAKADILNCKKLAHKGTIVIVDDVSNYLDQYTTWAVDPTKVWKEMRDNSIIQQIGYEDYAWGRGMVWGYYNL